MLLLAAPSPAAMDDLEEAIRQISELRDSDPDAALRLLDERLAQHGESVRAADAPLLRLRAETLRGLGRYDQAIIDAGRYLDALGDDPDPREHSRALFLHGTIAAEQNAFADALAYFHEARAILNEDLHANELARIYNAIAVTHVFGQNQERARPYYERALDLVRRGDNLALQSTILGNLASVVAALDDPDEAINLFERAMAIGREAGGPALWATHLANICDIQVQNARHEQALESCPKALELLQPSAQPRLLSGLTMTIGDLYRNMGQPGQALSRYQDALTLASGQVAHVEDQLLQRLADIHQELGQAEQVGNYLRRLLALRAELQERERRTAVEELEVRYQLEQREREIELLRLQGQLQASRLQQRNTWLAAMAIGLILVTVLALVILRSQYRAASLEDALSERNEALESAIERVGELAAHDSLTGLLNRRAFLGEAEKAIARAAESGRPISLALGDLDNFKQINDRFGHPIGDQVLKVFAERLRQALRSDDLVCRWGGEEFICLLPNVDQDQAVHLLERIQEALSAESITTAAGELEIQLTFGVAAIGIDLDQSILAADRAMYRGKQTGRNRIVAATPADYRRQSTSE